MAQAQHRISNRQGSSSVHMRGLSMIELLIAMVLGLSLTAGVMQVYVGNTQTDRDQEARARMQENGRFAISYLAHELRMAGYLGCLATIEENSINNTLDGPPASFQPDAGLQGWEANGTGFGSISNSANDVAPVSTTGGGWSSSGGNIMDTTQAVPASDIVRVWNAAGTGATINSISPGGAMTVVNSGIVDIEDGDILLLSDCQRADWVQACNVQEIGGGASINSVLSSGCVPGNDVTKALGTQAGGELVKLQGTMFYVGKRGNVASNPPALFRRRLNQTAGAGNPEELVEGIESLQILYGLNADNDNKKTVDAYVSAQQVTNWERVVSIRISVLVQSIENNMLPAPQPYTFNGVRYDGAAGNGALPADTRLRRVFTSTVTLRNRAVGS
ncbi:MAG: PilW family protein [Pseudomonadales bacterium]|nr:PilW family protein [Pseudomonadales bacterium]MCP5330912.1 PilW family protein [Pseudomonadales bacterium]MCP5343292.1 PilW family protein [Pseudomonadales bacterium]